VDPHDLPASDDSESVDEEAGSNCYRGRQVGAWVDASVHRRADPPVRTMYCESVAAADVDRGMPGVGLAQGSELESKWRHVTSRSPGAPRLVRPRRERQTRRWGPHAR